MKSIHIFILDSAQVRRQSVLKQLRVHDLEYHLIDCTGRRCLQKMQNKLLPSIIVVCPFLKNSRAIRTLLHASIQQGGNAYIFVFDSTDLEATFAQLQSSEHHRLTQTRVENLDQTLHKLLGYLNPETQAPAPQAAESGPAVAELRNAALLPLDLHLVISESGQILEVQEPAEPCFPIPPAELPGGALPVLAERYPAAAELHAQVRSTLEKNARQTRALHNWIDGARHTFEVRSAPATVPQKTAEGMVLLVIRDTTEEQSGNDAECLQNPEQADLVQIKLDLLANLNHELHTPMNGILGFASLLREHYAHNGEALDYVQAIHSSAERLRQTLRNIVLMAEIHSQRVVNTPTVFELNEEVEMLVRRYAAAAAEKGLDLTLDDKTEQHIIEFDYNLLRVIIDNILNNAIKFCDSGSIRVSLEHSDDRSRLRLVVKDTGIGMDPDFLPKARQDFSQESRGFARAYEGVGIGLAIVDHLCRMLDVTLSIESSNVAGPGRGTTVQIEIPVVHRLAH